MSTHRDKLLAAARAIVDQRHPDQTEGQRQSIADAIADDASFSTWCAEGWSWPSEVELVWSAERAVKKVPAMTREVPDAFQTYEALLAAHETKMGPMLPQDRISLKRKTDAMNDDERLTATAGLSITPKAAAAETTLPANMDDALDALDALNGERLGYRDVKEYRANVWASKILQHRQYARNNGLAPPTAPAPVATKVDTANPKFQKLSPTQRINAHRRAMAGDKGSK